MSFLLLIPVFLAIYMLAVRFDFKEMNGRGQQLPISVVIAARNESEVIGPLVEQIVEQGFEEVIVVDDHSADDTARIALEAGAVVISLQGEEGKKSAISRGVKEARHECILQLDADVVLPIGYRQCLTLDALQNKDLIILPVRIKETDSFIGELQRFEQSALLWVSGAMARLHRPILANGANMIYRKSAFLKVDPFSGNRDLASGDDQFLLDSMLRKGYEVELMLHRNLVVETEPERTWHGFKAQRLRWAGKMFKAWTVWSWLLSAIVLATTLIPIGYMIAMASGVMTMMWIDIAAIAFWYASHIIVVYRMNRFLGASTKAMLVPLWSIMFSFYAPLIAILSIFVKPTWKGRRI